MTETHKAEEMGQAEQIRAKDGEKRKTRLSPEINEFLHMLKSLETELEPKPSTR